MSSSQIQSAEEIYRAALNVSEEQRNFFIWEKCGNNSELYSEVQLLFALQRSSASEQKTLDFKNNVITSPQSDRATVEFKTSVSDLPQTEYAVRGLIGQVIDGRYYVQRKLGSGGMGDVYLASDKPEMYSRRVVVKVLKEAAFQNEYTLKKFKQEIEALTRLDGVRGAVGIIDAGTLPTKEPFLVMRYVEGESLRTFIKPESGMEFEEIAKIIKQIGEALTESHNKGVFHRDLKPENIIVERIGGNDFKVTVIDFGIAKVLESVVEKTTPVSTFTGTINYISPEQISRTPITAASDVYLLGIVGYEMLTGRRPFNPKTPNQIFDMQKAGVQVMPQAWKPNVPDAAQKAVLKALSWDSSQRQQSAKEFGDELSSALLNRNVQQINYHSKPVNFIAQQALTEDIKKPVSKVWLLVPIALLIGILVIVSAAIFITKYKPGAATATESDSPKRTLTFWLSVRMCKDSVNWCRDKNTAVFGNPIKSTGEQVFSNGTNISFHALSPQTGYLYIVIEGQGENNSTKWTAVFPNPKDNGGVSRVNANQELTTVEISADSNTGTETLWIVWSESQLDELENLFKSDIDKSNGTFLQSSHERLKMFFKNESASKVKSEVIESPSPQIVFKGNDAVFILPKKIKHENY